MESPVKPFHFSGAAFELDPASLGIPIIRRASLAGYASLLIGGPANLLDAWALWRSRIRADDALLDGAGKLLKDAVQGVPADQVNNPSAVALLARMGLIKATIAQNDQLILQATAKGADLSSNWSGHPDSWPC